MNFDLSQIDFEEAEQQTTQNDFAAIPAGPYLAMLEKVEIKKFGDNEDNTLFIQYRILKGDYEKRVVTSFLTLEASKLQHLNQESAEYKKIQKALMLSRASLGKIANAIDKESGIGLLKKQGVDYLFDKIVVINVTVKQPADKTKPPRNFVWSADHRSTYDESKSPKRQSNTTTYSNSDECPF